MKALREQIRELEQENIREKDWVLRGEVSSKGRPQNSLLEEDLDFERITKPVPIVTDEIVQDLESRIKARILDGRFDDVVRKRPVDDKPFLPSKVFELQDSKSKESLAQIYENEYMAEQGNGAVDDRDGRLMKEHKELEQMWEGICYKLDALSNAHFTPKQVGIFHCWLWPLKPEHYHLSPRLQSRQSRTCRQFHSNQPYPLLRRRLPFSHRKKFSHPILLILSQSESLHLRKSSPYE